ncbi:MAG: hypothetical protein ACYC69_02905 [Thermodesulfovibrionales bacterium]
MIDVIPNEVRQISANGFGIFRSEYIYSMGEPLILISCISEPDIDAVESFLVFNGQVLSDRITYSGLIALGDQVYTREKVQGEMLVSLFRTSMRRIRVLISARVLEQPDLKYIIPNKIEFAPVQQYAFRIEICANRDRLADLKIIREGTKSAALRDYVDDILSKSTLVTIERTT